MKEAGAVRFGNGRLSYLKCACIILKIAKELFF